MGRRKNQGGVAPRAPRAAGVSGRGRGRPAARVPPRREVRWGLTADRWAWREGLYHLDKSIFSRTREQNPSDVGGEGTRCEQPVEGL